MCTCAQSFRKICWPVSDLWISCQTDKTWANVCLSNLDLIGLNNIEIKHLSEVDIIRSVPKNLPREVRMSEGIL